jgi:hypothetical protein
MTLTGEAAERTADENVAQEDPMPYGSFLDSLPSSLFVTAHVLFLVVGIWAATRLSGAKAPYALAFWLYAASQIVFLAFFGGTITMKLAVLFEQTMMVLLVAFVATRRAT